MEGGMVFEGSVLFHNDRLPSSNSDVLDNIWISNPSSSFQHGSTSMVNFEASQGELNSMMITPFLSPLDSGENLDEDCDRPAFYQPEKKRRLNAAQVEFLEKSFELENKLDPDRKNQLAKELNLQPRQVAIWFQNRRARYKNKQLEKDYDILKASYDKLKVDYGSLQNENEKLKQEVHLLMEKLADREKGDEIGSKQCEMNIGSIDMEGSKRNSIVNSMNVPNVGQNVMIYKVEDANSANSEGDSCQFFDRENSDFSQDEDENLISRSLLRPPSFPMLEEGLLRPYIDVSECSGNLGYGSVEDEPFWFWAN